MQHKQLVITSIMLPILVGIVLLLIEHGLFVTSEDRATSIVPVQVEPEIMSSSDPAVPDAIPRHEAPPPDTPPVTGSLANADDLESLIAVADKLYGPDARNEEYQKINDVAIARGELEMAAQVAAKVYGPDPRNREYTKIISALIARGDFDFAEEVAGSIYGVDERNTEYKRILNGRLSAASSAGVPKDSLQVRRP